MRTIFARLSCFTLIHSNIRRSFWIFSVLLDSASVGRAPCVGLYRCIGCRCAMSLHFHRRLLIIVLIRLRDLVIECEFLFLRCTARVFAFLDSARTAITMNSWTRVSKSYLLQLENSLPAGIRKKNKTNIKIWKWLNLVFVYTLYFQAIVSCYWITRDIYLVTINGFSRIRRRSLRRSCSASSSSAPAPFFGRRSLSVNRTKWN